MSILESILNAQGGHLPDALGRQFGLDPHQTRSALSALLPTLAGAAQQNAASAGGLAGLLGALTHGGHDQYLEQPSALTSPAAVEDGNGILGHLLGSKDVSRELAQRASAQTGIGSDLLKRMLPVVASLVMGALANRARAGGAAGGFPGSGGLAAPGAAGAAPTAGGGFGDLLGGLLGGGPGSGPGGATGAGVGAGTGSGTGAAHGGMGGVLGSLLDRNRNGTPMDDVLEMAAGFLNRR